MKLLNRVRTEIRRRNYSYKTEQSYTRWIVRFIKYHGLTHPLKMGKHEIVEFLNYLAVQRNVAASTQNQALCAIVFLYKQVLNEPVGELNQLKRAKKPKRIPVVLSKKEVADILEAINKPVPYLITALIYGSGMRISEALRLRIKDVDLANRQIYVRNSKGRKDRITLLPESLINRIKAHLKQVQQLHNRDLKMGKGKVKLPDALHRKYPRANRSFKWQYVFPSKKLSRDPPSGILRRYHLSPGLFIKKFLHEQGKVEIMRKTYIDTLRK